MSDVADRVKKIVVEHLAAELFLKRHDQLDSVEAVSAKIIDKACAIDNLVGVNAKMFYHDVPNTI